jgi:hypothetical protein
MGHKEETNVFLMDVGYSDVEEGIRLDWRSKDFPITREKNEYTNQDFYFKLKPDNAQDIDIGLFARANMGAPTAPSTWGTLVKEFTLGDDNTVDMKMVRISGAKGLKGRTLGIRIVVDNSLPFCLYELMETHNVGEAEILLT